MAGRPKRNFHVPLSEDEYDSLRKEAELTRQPATLIARRAIEEWLARRRRFAVAEGIASYAASVAGSAADLDTDLEAATVDYLTGSEGER